MSSSKLKFAFFGTPEVSSKTLQILKDKGFIPSLILTSPDSPKGRGLILTETPTSLWAKENDIPCLKPEKIDPLFINKLSLENFELFIVVAYGKILPEELIKTPELGTINIHYSLLPKWRGASPLEAALLNGEEKTGISIQQMEFKLDSGPILAEEEIEIAINDTKEEIRDTLIGLGGNCLCDLLPKIQNKDLEPKQQDESQATFCRKIKKEHGEIDLLGDQKELWNKYRAFYGWPGIFFFIEYKGKQIRIKITWATYKNNSFIVKRVIPEGKKEMSYDEFLKWQQA
jgi:methionyl-tRNA formyltransferase